MKLILIFIGLLCSFFKGSSQQEKLKEDILIAHSWEIKTHAMTGIGIHTSIPKGTTIDFLKDKTWKSSEPIENYKTGKWFLENDAHSFAMTFGNSEKEFQMLEISTEKLSYRHSRLGAVYTFEWRAKQ